MSPLPGIPSQPKPPQAPQKKRRSTSIRTVPKPMQKQYLERLRKLRTEPLAVLPECIGPEPKLLAKARIRLAKMEGSKPGFLDKRDKLIVGAVAQAWSVADWTEAPRMLDAKVGGQRRFFVQRGHVERAVNLGIQNYDHAPSLLMAYRTIAKTENIHFFAQPKLWCTGVKPTPPQEWVEALSERSKVELTPDGEGWNCGHDDACVILTFRGGPSVRVCGRCGKKATHFHMLLTSRYAGPRRRQPVEISIRAPDGQLLEPDAEAVAGYRGGIVSEDELIKGALVQWTPQGTVWMRDGHIHRSIDEWLDALGAKPWECTALKVMAANGFEGEATSVAQVLEELRAKLPAGVASLLPGTTGAWLDAHNSMAIRDILRAADEESRRREATAKLPVQSDLKQVGTFIDTVARARLADGKAEAVAVIRRANEQHQVPALHQWIVLHALGGDVSLESRIGHEQREHGESLVSLAAAIFESEGAAYGEALRAYLRDTGTGEA